MGKLKKTLGSKEKGATPMVQVESEVSEARPGAWKTMLLPAPDESTVNKHRQVPIAIDEQVVQDVANGGQASEIEDKYSLQRGYVRRVLIRRFGSIEGMKKALTAQCLENAIILNEYAIERKEQIPPAAALMGAKVMIDGAIAIEKSTVDRPSTVDFASLAALGSTLVRLERWVDGTDKTISPAPVVSLT